MFTIFTDTDTAVIQRSWDNVGLDLECDTSSGEVQLDPISSFRSIQGCQDACEADSGCQSITYFAASGMCKRYSTLCTSTKSSTGYISLRFVDSAQSQSQEAAAAVDTQSQSWETKEHYLRISATAQHQLGQISVTFSLSVIIFSTVVFHI